MRNYNRYYAFLLAFTLYLFSGGGVNGQEIADQGRIESFEKIYAETDRDLYFSGETIHFSANYLTGKMQVKTLVSKILYAELLNCSDRRSVVAQKYFNENGRISGQLTIPDGLQSGVYQLKIYTQLQRNFVDGGSSVFLTILNPVLPVALDKALMNDSILIAPDGSSPDGVDSNRYIIYLPTQWRQSEARYFIITPSKTIVEQFYPSRNGLAKIGPFAQAVQDCSILTVNNDNDSVYFRLPENHLRQSNTTVTLDGKICQFTYRQLNSDTFRKEFRLKVYTPRFNTVYEKPVVFDKPEVEWNIPAEILEQGINHFILSDTAGNIQSINSVYLPPSLIPVEIHPVKTSIKQRDTVEVEIHTKTPVSGQVPMLSVSVAMEGSQKEGFPFVAGLIRNPFVLNDFLISNPLLPEEEVRMILKLFDFFTDKSILMNLEKAALKGQSTNLPEPRGLTINGILRDKNTHQPVEGHKIYVSVLFNHPQLHVCETKDDGKFSCVLNHLEMLNDLYLCPALSSGNEDNYEILITNPFISEINPFKDIPYFAGMLDKKTLDEMYWNAQTAGFFGNQKEIEQHLRKKAEMENINSSKRTIRLSDYVKLNNMEELFIEILPGAEFKKERGKYSIKIRTDNSGLASEEPLVLVDNLPVFDMNQIMQMDVSDVVKVEIIDKLYVLGDNVFQGVLMITTNTDDFAGIKNPSASVFIEYQGVQATTYFAEPTFPVNIPDFRTTLFWDPDFSIPVGGDKIRFVTSDRKGKYNIIIRGSSPEGDIYFGKCPIEVR